MILIYEKAKHFHPHPDIIRHSDDRAHLTGERRFLDRIRWEDALGLVGPFYHPACPGRNCILAKPVAKGEGTADFKRQST